jgi:enoyl-[acyl-carrier-protein] reductase (NADH)
MWLNDTPGKRLMEPSEIAATIGFLVSDAASGITGQNVMTDNGYSAS